VRILYSQTFVHVNFGYGITAAIAILKGVKQGDPMASSLYVLCIEPLLINLSRKLLHLKTSPFVDDPLTVFSAYADDTGVFISAESQLPIDSEFNNFSTYSGASLNNNKCEILPLGNMKNLSLKTSYKILNRNIKF